MCWIIRKDVQCYVKKYEQKLATNLIIPIIKDRLPDSANFEACMDPHYDTNGNIDSVIAKTKKDALPEHYLHELIHIQLFYIENFKTLGHPDSFQDKNKIEQENIIFARIVDDRIVHERIYNQGFDPIHPIFFKDILQQGKYLRDNNPLALNCYDNWKPETANLFKALRFLLAKSVNESFPKILNEERKIILDTFINLFPSKFPVAYKIATDIGTIIRKHNIFHKDGHAMILKEIRDYMSISKGEVYLCEYKKVGNLYRLEKIE